MQRQKLLSHWERLFCHVMQTKSHGRRWKFRIEPLRRKLEAGYNPYLSDSDSSGDDSEAEEMSFQVSHVCVHVGVSMWVCPCGCVHVGVSTWVCPCGCVHVGVSNYRVTIQPNAMNYWEKKYVCIGCISILLSLV